MAVSEGNVVAHCDFKLTNNLLTFSVSPISLPCRPWEMVALPMLL